MSEIEIKARESPRKYKTEYPPSEFKHRYHTEDYNKYYNTDLGMFMLACGDAMYGIEAVYDELVDNYPQELNQKIVREFFAFLRPSLAAYFDLSQKSLSVMGCWSEKYKRDSQIIRKQLRNIKCYRKKRPLTTKDVGDCFYSLTMIHKYFHDISMESGNCCKLSIFKDDVDMDELWSWFLEFFEEE
jgi:hypothetical protein